MWKPISSYFTSWCQVIIGLQTLKFTFLHLLPIYLALEEDSFLNVQDLSCKYIEVWSSVFLMRWFLNCLITHAPNWRGLSEAPPSRVWPLPPSSLSTSRPPPTLPQCLAGTGAWQRVNTAVKLHSPRYPVFDLQDGQRYQFRVSSVNVHGSSEPSVPSEPIQKVDQDGKTLESLEPWRWLTQGRF